MLGCRARRAREEESAECGVPPLAAERDARQSHVRRGWYWGSQAFAEELLKLAARAGSQPKSRNYRSAPATHLHEESRARALLEDGLRDCGLKTEELTRLPGSDARKVKIALAIRLQTTVSNGWLAEHLAMRSAANVSQILRRASAVQPSVKI